MIYFDNNATTRLAPEAREAMLPWLGDDYGNPSAGYRFGRAARKAVDHAREQVAALIGAQPDEIVFTSGGTESNNTAIRSAIALRPDRTALVTSTVEHSAVDEVFRMFDQAGRCPTGLDARFNPVDSLGQLDLEQWRTNLEEDDAILASLIWANNETGVYSPVAEAAGIAAEHDVIFHTDAVQAVGKIPIDVSGLQELMKNDSDKLRVINVWATWCGPCVTEFPELVTIHRMYRNRDFEMITISSDAIKKKDKVLGFLQKNEASMRNYIFSGKSSYELVEALDKEWLGALPYTVIVKPGGEVIFRTMEGIDPLEVKRKIVSVLGRVYE